MIIEVSKFNMDYSNADSEIIESLDLLRPPVKRLTNKPWDNINIGENPPFDVCKGDIGNFKKHNSKDINTQTSSKDPEFVTSSNYLIQTKSPEKQILGRYSVVSYTSLLHPTFRKEKIHKFINEDKPLVKITVIPKKQLTQTGRFHRKPEHNIKGVQSTVSNQENSTHPKKLFLIVAGNKEKIYEIKPSESAQFSCGSIESKLLDGKNYVKGTANIKKLITSLEMDKKIIKNKKNKIITRNKTLKFDDVAVDSNLLKECNCKESSGQANRVRIFGRVGLTDDDNYVLDCTASVDNKPITTITNAMGNNSSQIFFTNNADQSKSFQHHTGDCVRGCNKFNNNEVESEYFQNYKTYGCVTGCNKVNIFKKQKDSSIQVDFGNFNNNYNTNRNSFKGNESQATQVNLEIQAPKEEKLKDQNISIANQCNCNNLDNMKNISENGTERSTLRTYQSPLVIISVYPKQEPTEIRNLDKMTGTKDTMRPQFNRKIDTNRNSNQANKKQIARSHQASPLRSRSPSPVKNCFNQINKDNAKCGMRIVQSTKRNNSPPRQFNGITNKITQNKEKTKQQVKRTMDLWTTQNQTNMNCILKSRDTKNIQEKLKKTLVDDYTKMLTENRIRNFGNNSTRNENSRVKINIDNDNDRYDLIFDRDKLKTDLRVRKTVKEPGSCKYVENSDKGFIKPRKRKVSPVKHIYQNNDVLDYQNRTSILNTRDSLEIAHRRETNNRTKETSTHQSQDKSKDYGKKIAPIKHYRGDNCKLPDPVERDKQIRELLGVVKGIATTSKQEHNFGSVFGEESLIQCFYKKTNKKIENRNNPDNLCTCSCSNDKNEDMNDSSNNANKCCKNVGTKSSLEKNSLYQQVILNRNIHVFLQVEQFTKRKPIILSRKQYNRVKKTIQKTIPKKAAQDKFKNSISVGEVRKRTKHNKPLECECENFVENKSSDSIVNKSNGCDKTFRNNENSFGCDCCEQRQVQTIALFDSNKDENTNKDTRKRPIDTDKKAVSSLEICYTNVAFKKRFTFSSTNVESLSSNSFNRRNNSLYTIFKGHRRTPTPNLGTSDISIMSDASKSKSFDNSLSTPDMKAKRPFLRRLMSCLVMQTKISEKKLPTRPARKTPTVNSVDSYHINTSLGALEMSSSMYDTSASFYSNHTVCPVINNKMKRGFFSSVRGFLTSRRS